MDTRDGTQGTGTPLAQSDISPKGRASLPSLCVGLCGLAGALVTLAGCATNPAAFALTAQNAEFTVSIAGEYVNEQAPWGGQARALIWQIDGSTVPQPDRRNPDLPNRVWLRAGRHSLGVAYQVTSAGRVDPSGLRGEARVTGITLEGGANYIVRGHRSVSVVRLQIIRDGPEPVVVWSGWANLELISPDTGPVQMRIL